LDQALAIQRERSYFSPIGMILLKLGYLSKDQLHIILETQKKRLPKPAIAPQEKRDDLIFGYLAEKLNYVTVAAIYDGLAFQNQMVRRGLLFRLSEILINQGYITVKEAQQLSDEQDRLIIPCPGCDTKYNILGLQTSQFLCKKCGCELEIPEDLLKTYDAAEIEAFRVNLDEMAHQETLELLSGAASFRQSKKRKTPEAADDWPLRLSIGVSETSDEDAMEEAIGERMDELNFITAGEATAGKLEEHKYTDEWYWSRDIIPDFGGEISSADMGCDDVKDEEIIDIASLSQQTKHRSITTDEDRFSLENPNHQRYQNRKAK